ncbi:hypothetical protein PPACK8108_LOCUS13627 [Phakopsora pachyrhizi]|uniref:Tet-like 2OG-Fe(II) oxygenase domain-containing protein n=1 Tax=Phakopsora pachyrhizi TaxID=170000 RepID=A0AAV0B595_PHAPC|nr:hypothetical protein PPACK8108_LOCUS13627 [Phakopsora pachyrhizi]
MNYNLEDEAEEFEYIGCFLSEQFRNVAPGSHQSCKEYLQQGSIPPITQENHTSNTTYFPDDFYLAITYTMDDFSNKAHYDRDTDNWTLIGFIPIEKGGSIAEDGFDVEGGEFFLRDLKVFIDFSKANGVVLVILKTSKCVHQTIPSKSKSGLYTCFGFSCQISRKTSHAIKKYMNGEYEGKEHTFGSYDLSSLLELSTHLMLFNVSLISSKFIEDLCFSNKLLSKTDPHWAQTLGVLLMSGLPEALCEIIDGDEPS